MVRSKVSEISFSLCVRDNTVPNKGGVCEPPLFIGLGIIDNLP
jgi:hypothetical protein